jgi:hypothetical protein
MTQEDKELLLRDLCSRLPYNPLVEYEGEDYNVLGIAHGRLVLCKPLMSHTLNENPRIEEIKPYLFPLSSITEEQLYELREIFGFEIEFSNGFIELSTFHHNKLGYLEMDAMFEWFNKNHFDYRGLIPMGLANDATGLNIY